MCCVVRSIVRSVSALSPFQAQVLMGTGKLEWGQGVRLVETPQLKGAAWRGLPLAVGEEKVLPSPLGFCGPPSQKPPFLLVWGVPVQGVRTRACPQWAHSSSGAVSFPAFALRGRVHILGNPRNRK